MKKTILTLGTLGTIVTATAVVISCSEKTTPTYDVNSLLSAQASKLSDTETTNKNFLRVGGENLTTWNKGVIGLENEGGGDWNHSFAELRAGDYIDFVFADASDIANFTNIMYYDNTLADKNISAGNDMDSIYFSKPVIKDGKVIALPEETGVFQSEGVEGEISIYSLKAVKKNVVRMTFNDIYPTQKKHLDAQIIYLRGFSDVNGDGVTDSKDEQMTPTFAIDGGEMYGNYQQPYVNTGKNYWHKGVTVGMHDQTIIDYLNK